jgi:hypothetical protein
MKQITTINLKSLKDRQIVEFSINSLEIFQKYQADFALDALVNSYENGVTQLQSSYKKQKTTLHTEKVVALDQQRDQSYKAIWHKTKAFAYQSDAKLVADAHKVQDVLKNYGGGKLTAFDFNGETAAIRKLVIDLNRLCAAELKTLELVAMLAQLEAENLAFETVYKDRNALEEENKLLFEMQQVRAQLSKIYTVLCKQIEILPLTFPDKSKKIQEFSVALNVLIGKYRPLIALEKKKEEKV